MSDQQTKQLILDAKNICIIPSKHNEPESLSGALALFYTLKDLQKNVNLIIEEFPENLKFLTPPVDFISTPKNFVISVPRNVADISQIYYEKNDDALKIHLTIEKGAIKKDNIAFYFSEVKPDLIITLGIQNFHQELEKKLDSFAYLMGAPILNIDNHTENKKFGSINLIQEKSLAEIIFNTIIILEKKPNNRAAECLLTGLTHYYDNFQKPKTSPEIFELCAQLMKAGADRLRIVENLYGKSNTSTNNESLYEFTNSKIRN